jgi:modulator of FtsH protease HflC
MSMKALVGLVIVLVAVLLGSQALYRVHETERAILLQFGNLVDADVKPGLHFKIPIAQDAKMFDARVLTLDSNPETYYTLEKKPLQVDSYVKWKVADVASFYESASFDLRRAERLLQERVNEGLRNEISSRNMHEVVSGERDLLMENLRASLDKVLRGYGVEVIDVRVKRIDLPLEVSTSVYDRMNSEREIEARQFRAQGQERALAIRAGADRQAVVIEAEAYRESEQIRGEGDAQSAKIYASAYSKDPEFYEFYRSINAYVNVFGDKGDLLILDPKSEFFKYLNKDS